MEENGLLQNIALSIDNERFKLIIFPTEQCNFRCIYCYENYQLGKMSDEVLESLKLFLSKRIPTLKIFELEWFGGEPLLEKNIVFDITRFTKQLCDKHNVIFYGKISTNGYLLDEDTFLRLNQYGIKGFHISFDGDKEIHNQYRRFNKPGLDTFDKIWDNLIRIHRHKELDFVFLFRCHLTAINNKSVESLLSKIKNTFYTDKRFTIHLKAISALGNGNDNNIPYLTKEVEGQYINNLMEKNKELSFLTVENDYICYAAQPNSFLIRSDGTIGKCTVALRCNENRVGRLLKNGTVDIDVTKFLFWCKGIDNLDKELLGCPYHTFQKRKEIN